MGAERRFFSVNRAATLALLLLVFNLTSLMASLFFLKSSQKAGYTEVQAKIYLSETLGSPFMALAADCTAPGKLVSGLSECLGDIPGGYCYHTSCDTVQAPCLTLEKPFKAYIVPKRQK